MALTEIPVELSSTPGIADSSNATAITIDSSENVAITGNLSATKLTSNNGVLELDDNGTHNGVINVPASLFINIDSDNGATGEDFVIAKDRTSTSGGTELFRVQEDGNVGIGVTPSSNLHVKGTGETQIYIDAAASNNPGIRLLENGTNKWTIGNDQSNDSLFFYNFATSSSNLIVDTAGHVTMPLQPAFLVQKSASQDNPATTDAITWDTERFDQNSDFGSNAFTAPVTGKYLLTMTIRTANADIDSNYIIFRLRTSNRDFDDIIDARAFDFDPTHWVFQRTVLADMDANDTASIIYYFQGGTAQLDIGTDSSFSGHLVA
jgi:hypothetical protein